jgi:hypothetical protein
MALTKKWPFIVASLLLLTAGVLQAQEIKKYITPDGKTIYSDVPVPGAREAGAIAQPQAVDPEAREQAEESAREEAQRAEEFARRAQEESSGQASVEEAEQQLEEAQNVLANGKEPLPGERKGTAGGGSRLTDAYYIRQKANEQAVIEAQRALDAARARR